MAVTAILLLLPEARRGWRWSLVPAAAAYAATLVLFVTATKLTTAANAIFLQDTAPLFMLLLGPLLLKEPVRRRDLLFIAAIAVGMLLFFTGAQQARATAPDPGTGNALGLISALTWALTLTGLRAAERHHAASGSSAGMTVVAMGNVLTAAATLPFAFPLPAVTTSDVAVIGWLGVFQIAMAYFCLTRGVRSVPALQATTILLLEPALNPVLAWVVHGENPGPRAIAGGAIIITATLFNSVSETSGTK